MKKISVNKILSLKDDFNIFKDSPAYDSSLLLNEIYPPLVISNDVLVWGHSILKTALEFDINELYCVNNSGEISDLLFLALKLENRPGLYTWTEKADIYSVLKNNSIQLSERILKLVQAEGSFIKTTEKFIKLNEFVRAIVLEAKIDLKTAFKLKDLSEEIFKLIFQNEKLSFAERRLILNYLLEISKRDQLDKNQLLKFVEAVLSKENPLKEIVKNRYPVLEEYKEKMEVFKNTYLKKTGIQIKEPDFFEGNSFNISFKFGGKKQFEKVISNLEIIKDHSDELFELL